MTGDLLVEAVFQVQLRRLRLHRLQLDGHVLVVVEVLAQPQLAKVAAADLLAHAKVGAHLGMGEGKIEGLCQIRCGVGIFLKDPLSIDWTKLSKVK